MSLKVSGRETMADPKKRIVSIQVCRGIAAMVVVLAHLSEARAKIFQDRLSGSFSARRYGG